MLAAVLRSLPFVAVLWLASAAASARGPVLADGGRTSYVIETGAEAPAAALAAADTLRAYLLRICGADFPVVASAPAGRPRLVVAIGPRRDPDTDFAALGTGGYRLRTRDRDLVFSAATADGFRHAVYGFLEDHLGCRMYSVAVQAIPRRERLELPPIDDVQVPRFTFRMQDIKDPAYVAWHRLDTSAGFGLFVHTFDDLVPPERYFADHPEYFSLVNGRRTPAGQLCLTNPDVLQVVTAELRRRMDARPEADFWSVSQNDTYAPCGCDACRALDEAAGGPSGSILAFVNRVAAEFPDKTISTLAYQYSRSAPRGIRPLPNVNIMLCSIECDRSRPLAGHPGSASFVQDVRDWSDLTSNIFLWDYVIGFRNLVSPFPNLRVLQPNLRFFADSGITAVFEQGLPVMHGEFAELRIYLLAKLMWNPDADVEAILDDFLPGYYGAAAPWIRRYIDAMHDALEASGESLSIYGYPLPSADGFLAPARLDEYEQFLERAEAAVAGEPEILERVRTAHLPVRFARLEQAKILGDRDRGCFEREADGSLRVRPGIDELLATFVDGCRRARIPRLWEHGTSPDEYLAATRLFLDEGARPHLALGRPVELSHPASPKYRDGDRNALVDGLRGWQDWRFHWLGFEGEDLAATIDLGEERPVSGIDTAFLQDVLSWVWLPLEVRFSVSTDGEGFGTVAVLENEVPADRDGMLREPFDCDFPAVPARWVRVEAVSRRTCPAWHKGAGGPAWIFIDEISVR